MYSSSVFGRNSERAHAFQKKCTFCGGVNNSAEKCSKKNKQEKKSRASGHSDNRQTEQTHRKSFRCGSEDHLIAKCPKPPKYNEKWQKQVRFNEKGNRACNNGEHKSDQKIYVSMAHMSGNYECHSRKFGDSSQLTNWILDYGTTCHTTPDGSDFIIDSRIHMIFQFL